MKSFDAWLDESTAHVAKKLAQKSTEKVVQSAGLATDVQGVPYHSPPAGWKEPLLSATTRASIIQNKVHALAQNLHGRFREGQYVKLRAVTRNYAAKDGCLARIATYAYDSHSPGTLSVLAIWNDDNDQSQGQRHGIYEEADFEAL